MSARSFFTSLIGGCVTALGIYLIEMNHEHSGMLYFMDSLQDILGAIFINSGYKVFTKLKEG